MLILPFQDKTPQIHPSVFIAPTAVIIGDVILAEGVSIWFGAVLRADLNQIVVGANTSIQDTCVLHSNKSRPTEVGANCVVGHGVIMEACQVGAGSLLGMNATILSGAILGEESIVGAGAVVKENTTYPPRVLLAGVPAEVRRELSAEQAARIQKGVESYRKITELYHLD